MKKVFIILVNYNGTRDTVDCINSLNKIDYPSYEIVLVDNASQDIVQLEKEVAKLENVKLIRLEENLGFASGTNIGIRYAKDHGAEYVLLLNNDTVVEETFLTELVNTAQAHSEAGIVTGKILFFSAPNRIWYAGGEMNLNKAMVRHLESGRIDSKITEEKEVTFVTGCLMLISSEALDVVGILDDSYFMYSEDVDYCYRMQKQNYKVIYTSKAIIYHKVSASTGGKSSAFSQYYRTRNDLWILSRYADKKVCAYVFYALRLIKRNLVGQFQVKNTIAGLKAYFRNEQGRALKA